jgi:hypothetical protein
MSCRDFNRDRPLSRILCDDAYCAVVLHRILSIERFIPISDPWVIDARNGLNYFIERSVQVGSTALKRGGA